MLTWICTEMKEQQCVSHTHLTATQGKAAGLLSTHIDVYALHQLDLAEDPAYTHNHCHISPAAPITPRGCLLTSLPR